MFKILCTGSPTRKTLARGVQEVFPTAEFVHLSNGYDFTTVEGLDKFRSIISNYNVFINASRIDLGIQSTLLQIVRDEWASGHVFNIGTVLEHDYFDWYDPSVTKDKLALRAMSLSMCSEEFKTTHIVMGGIRDESVNSDMKMNPVHVAKTIKWIMESTDIHVPIIGIENDYWIKDWKEQKAKGLK